MRVLVTGGAGYIGSVVAGQLVTAGHDVTVLTLPGLESLDADRSSITFSDHVDAICAAVKTTGRRVVLAVHDDVEPVVLGRLDRHLVVQADRVEDRPQLVEAVRPQRSDTEVQVDLRRDTHGDAQRGHLTPSIVRRRPPRPGRSP